MNCAIENLRHLVHYILLRDRFDCATVLFVTSGPVSLTERVYPYIISEFDTRVPYELSSAPPTVLNMWISRSKSMRWRDAPR